MGDFVGCLRGFFKRAFCGHLVRDAAAFAGVVFFTHRPHQQVADKTDKQQAGHDVHGDAVGLRGRHAAVDLALADVVYQHGAEHGGGGPGQEDAAVDCAHFQCAEQVFDVDGHGREAATVHGDDEAEADDEQGFAAAPAQRGDGEVEQRAEDEEDVVGGFAAEAVGDARPDEASAHVEQAQQADEAGRRRRADGRAPADGLRGKQLLYHHRSLAEHADAGGYVEAEYPKEQVKLRRFHRLRGGNVVRAHQFAGGFGGEAGGFPVGRGHADGEHAEHHKQEIKHAEHKEGFRHAGRCGAFEEVHQGDGERRGQHCAAAEAHNRQAGGHAGFVGKPFHQRGNGADVAQAEADAAEHAVAQIQQPQVVAVHAEGGDEKAQPEADGGGKHGFARPDALHPGAEQGGRRAQHGQRDAEHPADGGQRPVAGGGGGDAEDFGERGVEDGIGVNLADGEVDGQRGGRHQPAVETGGGDGAGFVEEGGHGSAVCVGEEAV